jgi:hypothetical protein
METKFITFGVNLSIYGSTTLVDLCPLFQLLNLYTVVRNPEKGDQTVARTLHTHRTA